MKVFPVMAHIKYEKDKIIQIDIIKQVEHKYGVEIDIGKESDFITYTHYRPKDSQKTYQLGFILDDLCLNPLDYDLIIEETGFKYTYFNNDNIFLEIHRPLNDMNHPAPSSYKSAGGFTVALMNRKTDEVIYKKGIRVLPSSISLEEYLLMINDLKLVNENLIYSNKSNVSIGGQWRFRYDSIKNFYDNILESINRITEKPEVSLISHKRNVSHTKVKKFRPESIIDIMMGKNKVRHFEYESSIDIYENIIIKYTLLRLLSKISLYKKLHFNHFNNLYQEIKTSLNYSSDILKTSINIAKQAF